MAVRTLRAIEAGRGNPRADVLDRIARGLGWPMWRLAKLADELETADRRPTDRPLPVPPLTRGQDAVSVLGISREDTNDRGRPGAGRTIAL